MVLPSNYPAQQGLYDPANEHDACGVAMVATLNKVATHEIVEKALTALRNLEHRGASGAEPDSGDGAGILIRVPDAFYRVVTDFKLPAEGHYATGIAFVAQGAEVRTEIAKIASEEGLTVLGWRDLPINAKSLGKTAVSVMPKFEQVFLAGNKDESGIALDRLAFCLRKRAEHSLDLYFPSLSSQTIVYKGMLTTGQLEEFFPDLSDVRVVSPLALVHSRFSTNTFPSWPLAHPYRFIAHNGEINTVKGNRNWMRARESLLASELIPGDLSRLFPIVEMSGSDSASFDEVLELLYLGGRSLPHSVLMMIPEAWENHTTMSQKRRDFYAFHASLIEPWDGPACVTFTDGHQVGAVLDRNGLRPSRFWVTDDGLVVLASEVGVLDFPAEKIVRKGRLQPGKMFLVDIAAGRIIEDDEIKDSLVAMRAMNGTKRLMRADKDFFDPQKESLIKVYSKTKHNVVKLGLITLYFDFIKEFSSSELKRIKALTLKWMDESEDWMILAQGLKLLEKLAKIDSKIQPDLIKVAKVLQKDSRKAVSAKAKKVLSNP